MKEKGERKTHINSHDYLNVTLAKQSYTSTKLQDKRHVETHAQIRDNSLHNVTTSDLFKSSNG